MTFPISIRAGWIQVTVSPQKRFDNPESFQQIIDPEELLSCWRSVKHIVDTIVDEQIDRSKSAVLHDAKTRSIVDIYNSLVVKKPVDEKILLGEVLRTGKFSKEEAKSLIKKIKQEKIEGGMAWY
jgi:hypothetical protein